MVKSIYFIIPLFLIGNAVWITGHLTAPELTTPVNDTSFNMMGDSCTKIVFTWSAVTGAANYALELQQLSDEDEWRLTMAPQFVDGPSTNHSYLFCQVGTYRWRIVPYDVRTVRGPESDWFFFQVLRRLQSL